MYIVAIDPAHKTGFQERAGLGLGSMEGVHESSVFWKIKKRPERGVVPSMSTLAVAC